jgi:hypothetical protein
MKTQLRIEMPARPETWEGLVARLSALSRPFLVGSSFSLGVGTMYEGELLCVHRLYF